MSSSGTASRAGHTPRAVARGLTLIELLMVIAVIAVLVGLLLPAVMAARQASLRTSCDNHLRQISLGMTQYHELTRGMVPPPPEPEKYPSGWAIAILPYTEEYVLATRFDYTQPLWSAGNLRVCQEYRPPMYVCPVVEELDSDQPGVGVTNYVMTVRQFDRDVADRDRRCGVKDASAGSRFPWPTSPENPPGRYERPHESAFQGLFGRE